MGAKRLYVKMKDGPKIIVKLFHYPSRSQVFFIIGLLRHLRANDPNNRSIIKLQQYINEKSPS